MDQYRLEAKRGDGTFSEVFMAYSLKTGKYVAIKCMKKKFQTIEKVKKLKQIQALKLLSPHDNVIKLIEVLYDEPSGKLALVFELMQQNLYECLVKRKNLSHQKIKYYMYLLLKSIVYIHKKGIFHRDIKPENVLITGDVIKLADFGSCKGVYSKHPYTEYISTRWYRAPECLMTDGYYDSKMDVWGYGCVLFQMISQFPLFNGSSELDQIHRINKVLGSPNPELLNRFKTKATHMKPNDWNFPHKKGIGFEKLIPNAPKQLVSLLYKLLQYDPVKRITAQEAIQHQYFAEVAQAVSTKFRSTIFGLPGTFSQNRSQKNDQTPEKYIAKGSKRKNQTLKKQSSKAAIQQEANSLPPIHQLRLDVKFNLYGSTVKTHDNIFKKTFANLVKKKDQNYIITGKKY